MTAGKERGDATWRPDPGRGGAFLEVPPARGVMDAVARDPFGKAVVVEIVLRAQLPFVDAGLKRG